MGKSNRSLKKEIIYISIARQAMKKNITCCHSEVNNVNYEEADV